MDVETIFRAVFCIEESVDIIKLMEAAITVAALKHPKELAERSKGIIDLLSTSTGKVDQVSATQHVAAKITDQEETVIKIQKRINDKGMQVMGTEKKPESTIVKDDKREQDLKLEASKKKLKERYVRIENGKRKIEVLDVKDVPKPMPCKVSCPSNRILRRCLS